MAEHHTRAGRARWHRDVLASAALVVLVAAALALTLGRPGVSVSTTAPQALARVRVSGLDARLDGLHATSDGHGIALVDEAGRVVPAHRVAQGQMVRIDASATPPPWLRWLVGPGASATITVRAPTGRPAGGVLVASGEGRLAVRFDRR